MSWASPFSVAGIALSYMAEVGRAKTNIKEAHLFSVMSKNHPPNSPKQVSLSPLSPAKLSSVNPLMVFPENTFRGNKQ